MKKAFFTLLLFCALGFPFLRAQTAPIKDLSGLPRVLLIGDSVSLDYTPTVEKLLAGKANIHHIPPNGETSASGAAYLDIWLGQEKWDLIHFNFGLHDAQFLTTTETQVNRGAYEKNIRDIVKRLRATGAKLIWASTTPAPPGPGFDSIPAYNSLAARIMAEYAIPIDDLYGLILPQQQQLQQPGTTHYKPQGAELLGEAVAASIAEQLSGLSAP